MSKSCQSEIASDCDESRKGGGKSAVETESVMRLDERCTKPLHVVRHLLFRVGQLRGIRALALRKACFPPMSHVFEGVPFQVDPVFEVFLKSYT